MACTLNKAGQITVPRVPNSRSQNPTRKLCIALMMRMQDELRTGPDAIALHCTQVHCKFKPLPPPHPRNPHKFLTPFVGGATSCAPRIANSYSLQFSYQDFELFSPILVIANSRFAQITYEFCRVHRHFNQGISSSPRCTV